MRAVKTKIKIAPLGLRHGKTTARGLRAGRPMPRNGGPAGRKLAAANTRFATCFHRARAAGNKNFAARSMRFHRERPARHVMLRPRAPPE